MTFRVLITGSRDWSNAEVIEQALSPYASPDAVLVSGSCPSGADSIAERIWAAWGLPIERHPADWKRYGKMAGLKRNRQMVDSGVDVCLAFRRNYSRGTTHCANYSTMSGVDTYWFTEDED